jgi:hypothetical protein
MELEPVVEQIVANEVQQLPVVVAAIHDYYFDLDKTTFDSTTATLSFTFARPPAGVAEKRQFLPKRYELGYVESFLRIRRVLHWMIDDTNNVGYYDFNEIKYDPERKIVIVTTGIPILIEVKVEALDVVVEITNRVLADRGAETT